MMIYVKTNNPKKSCKELNKYYNGLGIKCEKKQNDLLLYKARIKFVDLDFNFVCDKIVVKDQMEGPSMLASKILKEYYKEYEGVSP